MSQQLFLPSPAERTLSQAESLALVQIFLNSSLACIAHTRELIPWTSKCLQTRYIDQISLETPPNGQSLYSSFQALASEVASESQEIKILVRRGNGRADQILDMLENGVFDALERGYLQSLQVFVSKPAQEKLNVLETYHFAFFYEQGSITSIQINPTNHTFVLENAHKSFKAAIRALLRSLRDLPRLPGRRKLGMSLDFNQACPMLYQPPGFVDKDDFQEGDVQEICDALEAGAEDVVGMMDSGHYQVRVTVRLSNSEAQDSLIDPQDTEMSKQLQAMQKTSSNPSNNLLSTLRESLPRVKRPAAGSIPNGKRAKIQTDEKHLDREISGAEHRAKTPQSSQSLGDDSNAVDLTSPDVEKPSIDFVTLTSASSEEKWVSLHTSKLAELLVHCYAIQNGKAGYGEVFHQDLLTKGEIKRHRRSKDVRCECGSLHRSSKMLYCEICDSWQHTTCYGYDKGAATAVVPPPHCCYTCLLFSEDRDPGVSPLFLVLLRTAVNYLTTHVRPGLRIDENFLQTRLKPNRWTKEVLVHIMQRLVEEGLLEPRSGRLFEVKSLSNAELHQVKENCTGVLASIEHLYEKHSFGEQSLQDMHGLVKSLEALAHGQDYTAAEGCEQLTSYDEFGDPIHRWGYRAVPSDRRPYASMISGPAVTPAPRRKVSISRMLVNIDRSPSVASAVSVDDASSKIRDNVAYSTDLSTYDSTATSD